MWIKRNKRLSIEFFFFFKNIHFSHCLTEIYCILTIFLLKLFNILYKILNFSSVLFCISYFVFDKWVQCCLSHWKGYIKKIRMFRMNFLMPIIANIFVFIWDLYFLANLGDLNFAVFLGFSSDSKKKQLFLNIYLIEVMYSETCHGDHLYKETTFERRPLFKSPKVSFYCI